MFTRDNIKTGCNLVNNDRIQRSYYSIRHTNDIVDVSGLPENWISKSAGLNLTKYLIDKENNRNEVFEDICKYAKVISSVTDNKIRNIAKLLLSHIEQYERDMLDVVENIDLDNFSLSPHVRNESLKRINKFYSNEIEDIFTLQNESLSIERERSNDLKKLLQVQFQKLVETGYYPPLDLIQEFDKRIYEANHQFISNSRAYTELNAKLHIRADEYLTLMKSKLNQLSLGITIVNHTNYKPRERQAVRASISGSHCVTKPQQKHVGELEKLDDCVSVLERRYHVLISKLLGLFMGKLHNLHNIVVSKEDNLELVCDHYFDLQSEIDDISLCVLKIVDNTDMHFSLQNLSKCCILKIQTSVSAIENRLKEIYALLRDLLQTLHSHVDRVVLAKILILSCLEDILTTNDAAEQNNELSFNIALEQLQSSSDIEKLEYIYESLILTLDRMIDISKQNHISEINKLNIYKNLSELLANTSMCDLRCILEKYPKMQVENLYDTAVNENAVNSINLESTIPMPLAQAISQNEIQELYLMNWKKSFLERLDIWLQNVPTILSHQVNEWVNEKTRQLCMRQSTKLASYCIRKERIKVARDNRFVDLKYHNYRLESHLAAIYDLIENLPRHAAGFLSIDSPELYPFCDWIDKIQVNINILLNEDPPDNEAKKFKMRSYTARLTKYRSLFESSLNLVIENFKNDVNIQIQGARVSNVRFVSQLKLLGEGGRYCAQEAVKACATIIKSSDALELCWIKVTEALHQLRSQLLTLADQKMNPIQKIMFEVLKISDKSSTFDKKPLAKKKN